LRNDDRVECSYCGRRMVPRFITAYGELRESVCPFCGGTYRIFRTRLDKLIRIAAIGLAILCSLPLILGLIGGLLNWLL
jgi:uncharacterized Zn-finger protein